MSSSDPLIGQQLGNYLVQEPLGRGGMARVYKGLDMSLKRPVAIKTIEESLRASEGYAQRFEHEAQAVASLKHPNIVTVFHFGKHENLFYLVMEYIDGADLDAILRNYENNGELMPHSDVIRILEAMASALDYAHAQGVVHRDVKPSNIMLERDGRPVLTDFGLALKVSEGTLGDTFGSPHYISPEQAQNSANAVAQSDLYSLGVVAYELLTGVVPFDDPSPTAVAMQHILSPVPSPLVYNRQLSQSVEQILFKVLAKTPEERYATGREFIEALQPEIAALKENPAKIATTELPPLPSGMMPPPPRRLSMQTALDKLNQEMALTHAKGLALTYSPTVVKPQPSTRPVQRTNTSRGCLPYLLAGGAALIALALVGLFLSQTIQSGSVLPTSAVFPTSTDTPSLPTGMSLALGIVPTSTTQPTTATLTLTNTPSLTLTAPALTTQPSSTPSLSPTATFTVTATPQPSSTPTIIPTRTSTATPTDRPSSTPSPRPTTTSTTTATAQPTLTPSPSPTRRAFTPTLLSTSTTAATHSTTAPTVLYPNGLLLVFTWDSQGFYVLNQSNQKILVNNLSFDRVLDAGTFVNHFSGGRWAANYPYSEPSKCLILKVQGTYSNYNQCPHPYNSELNAFSPEVFWTTAAGSNQFRVLWNGQEVARCPLTPENCEIRLPR